MRTWQDLRFYALLQVLFDKGLITPAELEIKMSEFSLIEPWITGVGFYAPDPFFVRPDADAR